MGAQTGRDSAPIRKKRSLRVVWSSDEETESDNVGLRSRKDGRTYLRLGFLAVSGLFSAATFLCLIRKREWWYLALWKRPPHQSLGLPWLILVLALCQGVHRVYLKIPVNMRILFLLMEYGLHLTPYLLRHTFWAGRLPEIPCFRRTLPPRSGVGAFILQPQRVCLQVNQVLAWPVTFVTSRPRLLPSWLLLQTRFAVLAKIRGS